jgi:hypothetical protein
MSQRQQDRRGTVAKHRQAPEIDLLERFRDHRRLLVHVIVTVLLLSALAATAAWLLLNPTQPT